MTGSYLAEIFEQPAIIDAIPDAFTNDILKAIKRLGEQIQIGDIDHVILTGMGGSLHGSYALFIYLSKHLNVPVTVWDCSELVQQAQNIVTDRTAIIATSQSGESIELRKLTELPRKPKLSISVTNSGENALANWSDISLKTLAGSENTASTKTYTAGYAALYMLGRALTGNGPSAADDIKDASQKMRNFLDGWKGPVESAAAFLDPTQSLTFIGRGYSISSARIGALLTIEAAKIPCMGLSGGQFRHGPLELVREGFSSILFYGAENTAHLNRTTAEDIANFGGKVLWIAPEGAQVEASKNTRILTIPSAVDGLLPMLEALPIQFMQIPLAIARNFEPAAFLNASKITSKE